MPGSQALQQLGRADAAAAAPAPGRSWVGFSFNSGLGDAELIFYEFAGVQRHLADATAVELCISAVDVNVACRAGIDAVSCTA